jgi:hypothetical protein
MSIWKTLRDEKPTAYRYILVLTTSNKIVHAWWYELEKRFYRRYGSITPITNYKRWCYEDELAKQALEEN